MATYTTRVRITADRHLVLDLPEEVLPGEVEVTVSPAGEARVKHGATGAELLAHFRGRERAGWLGTGRTREAVDAELEALRDEWDSD